MRLLEFGLVVLLVVCLLLFSGCAQIEALMGNPVAKAGLHAGEVATTKGFGRAAVAFKDGFADDFLAAYNAKLIELGIDPETGEETSLPEIIPIE